MNWDLLLQPGTLAMLIPVLAIVYWIAHAVMKHRERMAMIARGIYPGSAKEQEED